MQTTLLGLSIAIILALVTALVGPVFIDWGSYRSTFEAEASRLIGQPVRVTGPIDVRVLPTPSLVLSGIEIGKPNSQGMLRARAIGVEFGLGPLVRGEFRAVEVHVTGPEAALLIDGAGKIDLPAMTAGFNLDALSIEKLQVDDGEINLGDAASGSRLTLRKLWFNGEMRSLAGPFKGEGAFVVAGGLYGYRVSAGRVEGNAARLRFSIDPSDRPLSIEGEGLIAIERGAPRFEGNLAMARPVGAVMADGKKLVSEPWRATAKVKASAASALLEQIDVQYGPEDRVIKLGGTAELKFGNNPRLESVLSARQIDLDRLLHTPDVPRRLPPDAIKALAERFVGGVQSPISMQIGIGVDALTLNGGLVQNLRGDIKINADSLKLEGFELRAPGGTQMQLSGRLAVTPQGIDFSGPVDIAATDPKALIAWFDGRADSSGTGRPLRARGDVTLGGGKIAIDRLRAEIDRKGFEGRLAYAWASREGPARLDAEVNAAELDIDGLLFFGRGTLGNTTFDRPSEIALAFDIGRATVLGVEARGAKAKLRYDGKGLQVERLNIADLGGTALNASGRIDTTSSSPRGSVALDIDARDLSGMAALISTFLPQAAPQIRRLADRLAPAKLRATLDVEPAPAGNGRSLARLNLGGGVGAMRIILAASATGEAARPGALDLKLDTKIESDDGGNVLALLGLGRMLAAEKRPQQFTLAVTGPLNGDLRVDGRLAGELDAVANGTIRFDPAAAGTLNLTVAKADLRRLRQAVAGKAPDPLPLTLRSQVALAGNKLTLNELSGSLGGSPLKGQLSIAFAATPNVEGRLEGDAIDAAAFVAAGIGMPMQPAASAPGQSPPWSAEPFQGGLYPEFSGRIDFKTARAAIGAGLITKDMKGRLRFAPAEIGLEDIEGELAGGRLAGQLTFRKSNDGITARGRVALTRADASLVIPGGPRSAINGRVALQAEVEGTGLSPKALIGSLGGTGVLTLENAQIAGLDPKAFPAVIRAVDQGLAVDATRVRDFITTALDAGRLAVAQIDTAITITGGQARIGTVVARGEGADVAISGTYELADSLIDGRVMLSAPRGSNASAGRPEVGIMLKGPLAAPKRTLDVAALSGWLALRSVEQQSKRVEEAERLAAEHARREAERVRLREEAERLAAIKAQEEAVRLRREEVERMQAAPLSPSVPFRVSPATAEPAARGSTEPAPTSPSAMQAPLLPPAIDIRPAAGSELAPTIPAPRPRVAPRPPAGLQPSSSNRAPLDLGLVGSQ